ncbi:MAG TPA: FMN-binding negative transcriptional regulator [Candidatus Binatia bacterium]|nr:FMN-binding negative transcriptional regulator [Candidatus Binatia bacterium]
MSVYIPDAFRGDAEQARDFIARYPFATLVTAPQGAIQVTHLPLLPDAGGTELAGHMARANPHVALLEQADSVAVFHGPHAFVSRGWYVQPSRNVPTWNFAVVHVTGRARLEPPQRNRAALESLAARFEPPHLPAIEDEPMQRLPAAVVAFRLPLARIEVKFKMSQNKPAADRAGVVAGLRATGRAEDAAVADWMARDG